MESRDWSSDVCSSDLFPSHDTGRPVIIGPSGGGASSILAASVFLIVSSSGFSTFTLIFGIRIGLLSSIGLEMFRSDTYPAPNLPLLSLPQLPNLTVPRPDLPYQNPPCRAMPRLSCHASPHRTLPYLILPELTIPYQFQNLFTLTLIVRSEASFCLAIVTGKQIGRAHV